MVVLIGFMGAGKTSVGRALAARLELPFVDLDEEIARAAHSSIPEIFAARGEKGFRALEREAARSTLAGTEAVVALGGGAGEAAETRSALGGATVVYLELSLEEVLRRIGDKQSRPMLQLHDPEALHARRRPLYESVADITIAVDGKTVEEVVADVVERLADTEASAR